MIAKILSEDLKTSKILNLGFSVDSPIKNNEIFYLKSSISLRNYYLKHQLIDQNQVPFKIPLAHCHDDVNLKDRCKSICLSDLEPNNFYE